MPSFYVRFEFNYFRIVKCAFILIAHMLVTENIYATTDPEALPSPLPIRKKSAQAQVYQTAQGGPYSLFEFNPADLIQSRVRLNGEYIVIDGFAFGGAGECQKIVDSNWTHTNCALGISATQYLESAGMKGLYLKGEADAYGAMFKINKKNAKTQNLFGLSLGLDAGYRFQISERFTSAAAYGARRKIPNFFNASDSPAPQEYLDRVDLWEARIQVTLGIAL